MGGPTVSSPKRERNPKKRVMVTGMGLVSVLGSDIDTYYDNLLDGASGITPIHKFDASEYPVRFGGQVRNFSSDGYIDGKTDRRLDDCWRYCLVAGKKALDNANLGKQALHTMDKSRMGVLVGSAVGGVSTFNNAAATFYEKGYKKITPFFFPYTMVNMGSALLAFKGPNYAVSTACATSNHCFYAAANHIRLSDADVMIAGGSEAAIIPLNLAGFISLGALSQRNDEPQKASRPWDKSRDDFVVGEGAGVLIMESLEHAMKRGVKIYGEYLGGAVTSDAHHITRPHPNGDAVAWCINKSLENAGVAPEEVNYINAQATSTPLGDLAEVKAIKKLFKSTSELEMNATKSMIGHAGGAAGALEAIATIITYVWMSRINISREQGYLNDNMEEKPIRVSQITA